MRLFALLLPGLAAAAPSPLSARQSPIDISGAYWNTHLIGAHGYLAYHLESMIAVLNNPKFAQIVARTCISSRVPQPIIPPTNPELVTKHCDDGLTYDRQTVNLTITQTLTVGNEILTLHGSALPEARHYAHGSAFTVANSTTDEIARVDVDYYCVQGGCFTPDGRERV